MVDKMQNNFQKIRARDLTKKIIATAVIPLMFFNGCAMIPIAAVAAAAGSQKKAKYYEQAEPCEERAEVREKNQLLLGFAGEKKDYSVNSGMFQELFSTFPESSAAYNNFQEMKKKQEGISNAAGWAIAGGFLTAALGLTMADLLLYPIKDKEPANIVKWTMVGAGGMTGAMGLIMAFTFMPSADADTKKALRDTVDIYNGKCSGKTGGGEKSDK